MILSEISQTYKDKILHHFTYMWDVKNTTTNKQINETKQK